MTAPALSAPPVSDRGLRVLAVDDRTPVLKAVLGLLRSDPLVRRAEGVTDVITALRRVREAMSSETPVEVLFIDVSTDENGGLGLGRAVARCAPRTAVVLVSPEARHAVAAFELGAMDYVLEPVGPQRLAVALRRAAERRQAGVARRDPAAPPHPDHRLPVDTGGATRFVNARDVRRVQAEGDYVRLHVDSRTFLVRLTMAALERTWADVGFLRIHRSHMVAIRHVDELRDDDGRLSVVVAGARLPVSRRHASRVRNALVRTRSVPA
jgi:two-component system response regulator LytT